MKSLLPRNLLAAALFLFVSCSKEMSKELSHNVVITQGNFYATVDGNQWNADSLQLILVNNNGVTISGLSKTGAEISILIPEFKTGTYTLNASSLPFSFYVNVFGNLTDVYYSNSGSAAGTVTIASIDTLNHLVSGSFQFTLVNPSDNSTKSVTSGIFSYVPYSGGSGNSTPPPVSTDTLKANADGNPFSPFQITTNVASNQLVIAGITTDGTTMALLMPANITIGSYNLDFGTGIYIGIYNPPGVTIGLVSQANGTLNIISHDVVAKRIIGTFSFIATPISSGTPVTITEGYFSVSYQ
ncbi:MAG TPA: DUF6252 family protein [Puia sp.]